MAVHVFLFTCPQNQYPQNRLAIAPNTKVFHFHCCWSWWKKNCRIFPRAYPQNRKSTKISILLKPIQFKVISYIKSNKSTHKSMEVFIIATLELSLYWMFTKFPKKLQQEVSEDCPFLTASTFSFFCFILRIFLSPTLWTHADRVCAKYWRETKNCMTVD